MEKRDSMGHQDRKGLSWMEWLKGWSSIIYEVFFQKILTRNIKTPLPLPPLSNMTCIVTGSTSGIGIEIARQLVQSGAHVIMAVRNPSSAQKLIEDWGKKTDNITLNVDVMELNLLSLESVVRFSKAFNSLSKPLNILINNAGIFSIGEPKRLSNDGNETHMQVNHFGPALLTLLLLPSLKRGAPSRVINVNSIMHAIGYVDTDDMNFTKRKFTSLQGYCSSKLAQVMFFSVLQRRLDKEMGVNVICVAPGSCQTNVARTLPKFLRFLYRMIPYFLFSSVEGSRSALFAAGDTEIPKYCDGLKAKECPVCAYVAYDCTMVSPSKEARRTNISNLVWNKTIEKVGLSFESVEMLLEGKEIEC